MTKDKRETINKHIANLRAAFPMLSREADPVDLFRKLTKLENEGHRFAERCCNEPISESKQEAIELVILAKLDALLGFRASKVPVFLNGDPRGCALKIEDAYVREKNLNIARDWGGYGLIAPEL